MDGGDLLQHERITSTDSRHNLPARVAISPAVQQCRCSSSRAVGGQSMFQASLVNIPGETRRVAVNNTRGQLLMSRSKNNKKKTY